MGRTSRTFRIAKNPALESELSDGDSAGTLRELPELHTGADGGSLPDGSLPDSGADVVREVPEKLDRRTWFREFEDVLELTGHRELPHYYYKSECRPLKTLKKFHRMGITGKCHAHSFREWLELRDRARKDLYWLGKKCIGTEQSGASFVDHVHREICDMFVPKNFDGVYHKDYTLDEVRQAIGRQNREREMLMLAPRGAFKSTANKVDAAQWMLNCPDVRILIITGAANLSDKFLKEVKGYFYQPDGIGMTYFQSLFPEYVIRGKDGISGADLVCPARICRQEGNPTLWVNSIGGTLAGWHCDVMKGDDIVNEENSNNEDTREKLKDRYDNVSSNLPDEWAFRDQLGTRYYVDDWYGTRIEEAKRYQDSNALKYLCRAAWTVKPGFEKVPIKMLQQHMVNLYFPEKLTFASLIAKVRNNEKQFRCQQLNEPAGGDIAIHFDEETIRASTITLNHVPRPDKGDRRIAIIWDTAHGEKTQSDYSAGAVGYCHEPSRTLYVLEVAYGKWRDSDSAKEVVELHWKWSAMFSEIEKFAGWELYAAEVQRVSMARYRKFIPLIWREADPTSGSKRNRVKGLETLINNHRLKFVDGDWMDTLTRQFIRFNGISTKRKDDIPDACAGLQRLIPAQVIEQEDVTETDAERKEREALELKRKFSEGQEAAAYHTIFAVPAPPPVEAPKTRARIDTGPGWVFGNTGIHL